MLTASSWPVDIVSENCNTASPEIDGSLHCNHVLHCTIFHLIDNQGGQRACMHEDLGEHWRVSASKKMTRASSHDDESTKPLLERDRYGSEGDEHDEEEVLHPDPRRYWVLCVYVVLVTHQVGGVPLLMLYVMHGNLLP